MSYLKLEDRLRVAIGAGMGVSLTPEETTKIAGWLMSLYSISRLYAKTPPRPAALNAALGLASEMAKDAVKDL